MNYQYAYYSKNIQEIPLNDDIKVISEPSCDEFFISNSKDIKAKIYAKEIDFYIRNSTENYLQKAKSISLLYEIRALIYANSKEEYFYNEHGEISYKSFINYTSKTCDYNERRGEVCLKCVQICPSDTIKQDGKTLSLNHETCISCGACVSVCPTGSMDFSSVCRESFLNISRMLKDKIILVISSKIDLDDLTVELKDGVIPLVVDSRMIDEWHFLTLAQQSGASVVFYDKKIFEPLEKCADFVNEIYRRRFNSKAVYLASNEAELKESLSLATILPNSYYDLANSNIHKRNATAKRIEFLVGDNNLGVMETSVFVNYAKVNIKNDKCTLCLSCAGACRAGALSIDKNTNSLLFNASVCTGCGYCEASCAEDECLSVTRGEFSLEKKSFTPQVLAKDELFACVECGDEFATKKAVDKIANIFKDRLADDELKLRALYCCSDCKAKLMSARVYEQQKAQMEAVNG